MRGAGRDGVKSCDRESICELCCAKEQPPNRVASNMPARGVTSTLGGVCRDESQGRLVGFGMNVLDTVALLEVVMRIPRLLRPLGKDPVYGPLVFWHESAVAMLN